MALEAKSIDQLFDFGVNFRQEMWKSLLKLKCTKLETKNESDQKDNINIFAWNIKGLDLNDSKDWFKMGALSEICNSEMPHIVVLVEVVTRSEQDHHSATESIRQNIVQLFNERAVCQDSSWNAVFLSDLRFSYSEEIVRESHVVLYRAPVFSVDSFPISLPSIQGTQRISLGCFRFKFMGTQTASKFTLVTVHLHKDHDPAVLHFQEMLSKLKDKDFRWCKEINDNEMIIAAGDFNFDLAEHKKGAYFNDIQICHGSSFTYTIREATNTGKEAKCLDNILVLSDASGRIQCGHTVQVKERFQFSDHLPISCTLSFPTQIEVVRELEETESSASSNLDEKDDHQIMFSSWIAEDMQFSQDDDLKKLASICDDLCSAQIPQIVVLVNVISEVDSEIDSIQSKMIEIFNKNGGVPWNSCCRSTSVSLKKGKESFIVLYRGIQRERSLNIDGFSSCLNPWDTSDSRWVKSKVCLCSLYASTKPQ
jgi:endonuclease/exonuclease/phosphatase family metal-dependent hydrolase